MITLELTQGQAEQLADMIADCKKDRVVFFIVTSRFDPERDRPAINAQFCAVNWKIGRQISTILKRESDSQ